MWVSKSACRPRFRVVESEERVTIIGVGPRKSTHTATAVDAATSTTVSSLRVDASIAGCRRLLCWARRYPQRIWAVEGALGLGCHLAQWLISQGETVLSASTTATARVLSRGFGGGPFAGVVVVYVPLPSVCML